MEQNNYPNCFRSGMIAEKSLAFNKCFTSSDIFPIKTVTHANSDNKKHRY